VPRNPQLSVPCRNNTSQWRATVDFPPRTGIPCDQNDVWLEKLWPQPPAGRSRSPAVFSRAPKFRSVVQGLCQGLAFCGGSISAAWLRPRHVSDWTRSPPPARGATGRIPRAAGAGTRPEIPGALRWSVSTSWIARGAAPSGHKERADRYVISVLVLERELLSLRVRIHVWLLLEATDECACPLQRQVEIIDGEKQEEPIAGCAVIGVH
jgi:hypothetical protein